MNETARREAQQATADAHARWVEQNPSFFEGLRVRVDADIAPALAQIKQAAQAVVDAVTAWDRAETDPCERGTTGCSILHGTSDTGDCETW